MSQLLPPLDEVSFAEIEAAAGRLAGVAHRTPVVTARRLDARHRILVELLLGRECLLKAGAVAHGDFRPAGLDGAGGLRWMWFVWWILLLLLLLLGRLLGARLRCGTRFDLDLDLDFGDLVAHATLAP